MVTINDVAKCAGVAISTVSNILNEKKYVSNEVTLRVLKAVEELNYEVDPIARNMKSSHSNIIGIIVTNSSRIFFPPVQRSARKVAASHQYNIFTVDSNDDFEQEKVYVNIMKQNRFDGIILDSIGEVDDEEYYHKLAKLTYRSKRIHMVSIERNLVQYGIDSVVPDNYNGARKVVKHLCECGCRSIMHITGPLNSYIAEERVRGYYDAISEENLDIGKCEVVFGDFSPQSGYLLMHKSIQDGSLKHVDAVFASNDQMAVGAIKALREVGVSVPKDVRVAGFDDTFVASLIEPPLTTVHVSGSRIGSEAMELLLARIEKPDTPPVCRMLDTELVVRLSTDCHAEGEWDFGDW